jgi:ureidoacrylate peracid hydrolase
MVESYSIQIKLFLIFAASALLCVPAFGQQQNRPENHFALDASEACLVIIDMQNFSCSPAKGEALPLLDDVIIKINKLADFSRKIGIPVVWVRHNINITANQASTDAGLYPSFHDANQVRCVSNRSNGTEIYPSMHFDPARDYVVFKNRYSAFLSNPPELRQKLESLKRTQLIVAGIAANVCVESTVRDAMQLDYEVVLVSDGVTASNDALLKSSLINTKLFFGDVRTAEEVMEALSENTI